MVPICNTTEPRLKLSKPRPRTIGATPSPGESRSDLKTLFTRETSPAITEFSNATGLQYDTRQGNKPLRKELDFEEDNEVDIGRSLRKRFSRSQPAISKRTSIRMSLGLGRGSALDVSERIREYGSEENINDTIVRKAFRDELAALSRPLEITIEEDDGVPERMISPIRRRSFFTPGLATRNPADMLAKPPLPAPKQQADLEYYYNPKCSPFSPLERIAALDLASRPETPQARASTPGDLDYGLIGRLHITNGGISSPALSSRSGLRRASTGLCNSVSYSDTPHMSMSEESIIQSYLQSARQSGHFQHPLKIMSTQQEAESWCDDSSTRTSIPEPKTPRSPSRDKPEIKSSNMRSERSTSPFQDVTSQIARDYMLGLADNPFDANPSMLNLLATSKPSEMEAELFDDSSLRPRESYETLQKSDFVLPDVVNIEDDFEKRTSKLLAQIGTSNSLLADHASLSNADSGYSSGSSVSSFGKKFKGSTDPRTIDMPKSATDIQELQQLTMKAKRRPAPMTIQTSTTVQNSPFSRSIQSSTDTLPTAATTISFSTEIPQLVSPRKLQKPRPRSQPPPSNRVAFQMHPEIDPNVVPRIPDDLAARMARRVEEIPPLNHTLPSVDHLRLKKVDFDHPPLSAPIRFPSPEPMNDKLWVQVLKAQGKKPKSVRGRRSHMDGLLFQGRRKKSLNITESAPNLISPGFDASSEDFRSKNRPTMMRSKSMATGLGDHDAAALSRVRSMAKVIDTKPLPDPMHPTRKPSSVYNDASSAVSSSAGVRATPDLRQSSSVSTLTTQSSSLSIRKRAQTVVPHTAPLPISPVSKLLIAKNHPRQFRQLYESNSHETLDQQQDIKSLPPLPLIPIDRHVEIHKDVKKSRSLEKTLPLLPHQRKIIQDTRSRELSPYSDKFLASSSNNSTSTVQTLREAVNRHARIQSEPPYFPSESRQHMPYPSLKSPSAYQQPTLPELDTTSASEERHYRSLANDYRLQSPYNRYSNRTRDSRSESPEYAHFAWSPAKSEFSPQLETHQEWPPSVSQKPDVYELPGQSPTVPEGLIARMSGRFEGGLHYNYEPGHGIHGSAGTSNIQTGMKKSVETSKGYGLDLTDIPIFIYAQGKNQEQKQRGGWI